MEGNAENLSSYLTRRVEALAAMVRQAANEIEVHSRQEMAGKESMDALIVDSVISRVKEIAEDCDELGRILSGYTALVGESGGVEPAANGPSPRPAATADDSKQEVSEGVRLLVTQMSVAGSGPAEIAQRLHDEFGVENSTALVQELFGQR